MDELHNITLLKKLSAQAGKLANPETTKAPHLRAAYEHIARGTGLLWRLIEQGGGGQRIGIEK